MANQFLRSITLSGGGVVGGEFASIADADLPSLAVQAWKPLVKALSIANVASLSGTITVDGQSLVAGDLVLLTAQTAGSQNGPWVVQSGAWTRPAWYASGSTTQAFYGITVFVLKGTLWGGVIAYLMTTAAVTVDTTATVWDIALIANRGLVNYTIPTNSDGGISMDGTATLGNTFRISLAPVTAHAVCLGTGSTGALGTATIGTSGRLLIDQGAGADPGFKAMSGDVTLAGDGTATLKGTGTAGTYTKVTTDAQGRVSSGTTLASADIAGLAVPATLSGTGWADVIAYLSANQALAASTFTVVPFDTVTTDSDSLFNTTGSTFTPATTGTYLINAAWSSNSGTSTRGIVSVFTGTTEIARIADGFLVQAGGTSLVKLTAATAYTVKAWTAGAGISMLGGSALTYLNVRRVK